MDQHKITIPQETHSHTVADKLTAAVPGSTSSTNGNDSASEDCCPETSESYKKFSTNPSYPTVNHRLHQKLCHFVNKYLESPTAHWVVIVLVVLDMIFVFIEISLTLFFPGMEHHGTKSEVDTSDSFLVQRFGLLPETLVRAMAETCFPAAPEGVVLAAEILGWLSFGIVCIFVIEITLRILAQLHHFFRKWWNIIDAIIVYLSFILELVFRGIAREVASLAVILRLWRIIRLVHAASESIEMEHQSKAKKLKIKLKELEDQLRVSQEKLAKIEESVGNPKEE
ncbi:hypothetical protein BKA69DRAFT_1129285 [Paraphysoderma sedebokerense]|nr:hypothetical protein BKA69DRAFT_1129285 [Paraphysoderma sedebokerense]